MVLTPARQISTPSVQRVGPSGRKSSKSPRAARILPITSVVAGCSPLASTQPGSRVVCLRSKIMVGLVGQPAAVRTG